MPLYFYGSGIDTSIKPYMSSSDDVGGSSSSNSNSNSGGMDSSESPHGNILRLGFYSGNFTRNEVQLSQTVIHYWANFIRTG